MTIHIEIHLCIYSELCIFLSWFRPDSFSTAVSTITDRGLLMMYLFLINTHLLCSPDVNWWTGWWCFYQTLILTAPIHCRATDAMLHFSKSDEETNHPKILFNYGYLWVKYIFTVSTKKTWSGTNVFNIDNNKKCSCAPNERIRMISEALSNTEDCTITGTNHVSKYINTCATFSTFLFQFFL